MDMSHMRQFDSTFRTATPAKTKPPNHAEASTRCGSHDGPTAQAIREAKCQYATICQQTGWGGQPIKSAAHGGTLDPGDSDSIAAKLTPITTSRRLRITFAGSTSDILPWKFTPQQREVRVLPGETALAFYTATNQSPTEDIIGVATYSVTPAQVAPYFSKIQCFCFEEQRLNKGETVDMPVFFYIDPEFLKDPNMKGIDSITLNYTFFKAKYDKNGHLAPMPMPY
ncbi:Cytochrome c oxidase assembly protein cox11, mitochondrial [Friedmanniomyces endolithicus]|nr:Cytochrome c oxidase assembly protein cox11, mitochondrial [Friedmanniomyces endolithicus]KAK0275788.1 Cytochrome c oxidase assembly protein cox11, mitochondrial [Friedmanniomyces endolithicus]KAK0979732.1 Cytochrome c oxidase assembly protein cox11, mitochondrial [Friedmanniomyces endolithicus]